MESIENVNYPAPKQEYKVLVRCFTYNQSKFIEDALNGFAMQQTNFPFVCIVMDDASTDGEQQVIKTWMKQECDMNKAETIEIPSSIVVIVPHKTNSSCTFAFYFLIQNLYKDYAKKIKLVTPWRERCEYEAICEGDDYWVDSLKLQKQVEVMDEDNNVYLSYTGFNNIDENNHVILRPQYEWYMRRSKSGCLLPELLKGNFILTCTTCFRLSLFYKDIFINANNSIDYSYFLCAASIGPIVYLPDKTSNYRLNSMGLTSNAKQYVHDIAMDAFVYYALLYISGNTQKYRFKEDIKIKIEILIKAFGLYYTRQNVDFMKKIFSIDRSLYLILPFAFCVWIFRKVKLL